ncbi:MAG: TolC family protein, partial [Bacillota bacterium]
RPVLVDSPPSFAVLEVADLTATVEGIVSNSPMQWIMDEGADLQERLAGLTGSSEKGKIKADQARLDAEKNRDDTRSRVYNTYYTLKQLEDSYSTVQRQMRLAEDSLKLSQLSYELGLVTRADVLSAQAALAQARAALFELTCRHALLKIAFYKPWVAGAVMSSGTGSAGGSTQSSGNNGAGL